MHKYSDLFPPFLDLRELSPYHIQSRYRDKEASVYEMSQNGESMHGINEKVAEESISEKSHTE